MREFKQPNRKQRLLFLDVDVESLAPIGSPVRVIDELVEKLDTSALESTYDLESPQGREPVHPKTFLKVALYALHNCRFSLRKMEQDIKTNILYQWLTGSITIDHSTLGKFLSCFTEEIAELFSQVVYICAEDDLIDFDVLAIDSVKIRAYASHKQAKTKKGLKKELEKIKARITELIDKAIINTAELEEFETLSLRKMALDATVRKREERISEKSKEKSEAEQEKIEEKEKINMTDHDAHIMQQRNGEKNPSYSITTATDTRNDILTAIQINESDNDVEALVPAMEQSEENTGEPHTTYCADPAFSSMENLKSLDELGADVLMPDRRMEVEQSGQTKKGSYDRSRFTYNRNEDTYQCPAGKLLHYIREVRMNGRTYALYENPKACGMCKHRNECTKGKNRKILRDSREDLKENMRNKLKKKKNKTRYKRRAHAAESPYGHIKQNLKFRNTYRRGIEKIRMEFSLIGILYNGLKLTPCLCAGAG